jgi:hypothetical protein
MTTETVNSKEALFMLDTDMEQDMQAYGREVTLQAIKHINSDPQLYKYVKENAKYGMSYEDSARTWASNHKEEFGPLFITELDSVDWKEVKRRV